MILVSCENATAREGGDKTMAYDYSKLRGKIREVYNQQDEFARAMGKSPATLSKKLNNQVDWSRVEIDRACELLGIPLEEVPLYFFTR
jgi:transcriptional regulator with XRE-family HTH domain